MPPPPRCASSVLLLMDDDQQFAERVTLATRGRAHLRVAIEAAAALDVVDRVGSSLAGVLIGSRCWSPDGRRIVAHLQRQHPWERTPSLVLVDEPAAPLLDRLIDEGANGVVARPVDVGEVETVLSLLARLRVWGTDFSTTVHGGPDARR